MTTARLETFSDGVLAIVITIMVLELPIPHEPTLEALRPVLPVFLSYALSFVYVGIYWNNHHHLLYTATRMDGRTMWANLPLLFWLSVIPFVTAWNGEDGFAAVSMAFCAGVLLMCGVALSLLERALQSIPDANEALQDALGADRWKESASMVAYLVAIPAALLVHPGIAGALFVAVAGLWIVPDRRIERTLEAQRASGESG